MSGPALLREDLFDIPLDQDVLGIRSFDPLSKPYTVEADERYPVWRDNMRGFLCMMDRWAVVSGHDAQPAASDSDVVSSEERAWAEERQRKWLRRDAEARFLIKNHLDADYRLSVTGCDTAKELWDKMHYTHIESGRGLKALRVYRRMHERKYEGGSLPDFAFAFVRDNDLLREYGTGMDEKMLALMILEALPVNDDVTRRVLVPLMESDEIFQENGELEPTALVMKRLREFEFAERLCGRTSAPGPPTQGRRHRKRR